MKNISLILVGFIAVLTTGCATSIRTPISGPTADLSVKVTNFDPKGSITNVENVYLYLNDADKSWGGEQLIKKKQPEQTFTIPANEEITFTLKLMQGGGGFSSACGVSFEVIPTENSDLHADFEFIRAKESKGIIGCTANLFSGSQKLGSYTGSSNITVYKLEILH